MPASWAAVASLLSTCRPPDVSGLVIAAVANSVQRPMPARNSFWVFRLQADGGLKVGQKVLKVMPSFAYRNTATAVVFIMSVCWVFASASHVLPNGIFRSGFANATLVGHPVFQKALSVNFPIHAAATLETASNQRRTDGDGFFTAVALAQPQSLAELVGSMVGYDDKFVEPLAGRND